MDSDPFHQRYSSEGGVSSAGRVATGDDSISSSFWIMSKHTGKDAFLSVDSFRVFIIWWN